MKILFVTNTYPTTDDPGFGAHVAAQVQSLQQQGVEVDVLFINPRESKWNYLKGFWWVFRQTRQTQYDVVHAHFGFCAIIARAQRRCPVVTSFMGSDVITQYKRWSRLRNWLCRLAVACSDVVIVKTPELKQYLRPYVRKRRDVHIMPNGVDLELFRPIDMAAARHRLGLPLDRKLVLFPYNPERLEDKRFDLLEQACALLEARGIPIEIVVAFDMAHELMPFYFSACDVLAITSNYEGSPNAVKEAMACNRPIVSTDVGDVKDVIGPTAGCFLAKKTPEDIADKLELAFKRTTTDGRARIAARFDSITVAQRLKDMYERIRRRTNVLILVQNLPLPQDRRVWMQAKSLHARQYRVSIISIGTPQQARYEELEGIHLYRYPMPPPTRGYLGYLWEIPYCWVRTFWLSLCIWRRHGIDIIQACNPPDTFFVIGAFYKLFGKKFVYDQHDIAPDIFLVRFRASRTQWLYRLLLWCERSSYRLAHLVIASSEASRAMALARGWVNPSRVVMVRSCPDPQDFAPQRPRKELKAGKPFLVCYVGVMGPQDGVDLLLQSVAHIKNMERDDIRFVLLGTGDCFNDLREQAAQLQLDGWVEFAGWMDREQVKQYLSTADLCVAPDPKNRFNDTCVHNKILEYMAMARPIVAYNLIQTKRLAKGAAAYVRGNDPRAFAEAMVDALDHPARCKQMGAEGRRRIEQELNWQHEEEIFCEAYLQLAPP